ncbi:hypothetical protein [Halalkalirubrum salinum]|uniref:hypothetical protein n=1 Tax=Halalkalirubrum salinum TaxID=2563889 RepID=UPI0010FBB9CC|nr:hypothetical protein [Halalkalirubrum salinum]
MNKTTRDRVLIALDERDTGLPEDGLTLEKIRERAFGFQLEADEWLSFQIERHPTMYLSDMGVPGLDTSPARFHIMTEYRLDLNDETWHIEELSSTFEYEPWMVLEAELGDGPVGRAIQEEIEKVKTADDPEATFEDVFGSWIDHWEDKFDDLDGRNVPEEDKDAILDLLVGELKERAELD